MRKVRITVMRKACYQDLMKKSGKKAYVKKDVKKDVKKKDGI